ncbi:helix-turn-helix domain-containing protein [Shewanella surugensis]|uniref:Helix-turn-helix domain-containing protein n=1 Tax=Shewanella surugensis TaxID=212020 RepID=A0ABT0L9V1_9GAMM|nr:helix-turn-helix transcriptional regulator [Shewanella surugensis]MCL1124135.1 helix-turn-helix domain-containing protein [Shewanella surugensis]
MSKKVQGFDILKTGRRIRGMTQTEVALHYGICIRTYRNWESGASPVSYDDILAFCDDVFQIPLAEVQRSAAYAN